MSARPAGGSTLASLGWRGSEPGRPKTSVKAPATYHDVYRNKSTSTKTPPFLPEPLLLPAQELACRLASGAREKGKLKNDG